MKTPRHWKPLSEISVDDFNPIRQEVVNVTMEQYKCTENEARMILEHEHRSARYWVNDLYQVMVAPCGPKNKMLHINIRRRDGGMFKDWRHFQQIKNEVAGPEREAVEIYPRESRLVDTSNKWHLWVAPEGATVDLGWFERDVQFEENRDVPGMRQRPL
jgi:hypothetical protein